MALLDLLQWRYATKKYDPTKKVAQADLDKILESIRLTPTSSGLQQFEVFVITNQALKEQMVPIAFGQQQLADCSHVLVFAAWDKYTEERIDKVYNQITQERGLPDGALSDYTNRLKSVYLNQTAEENFAHTSRQPYIALGLAMAQAAELQVDATPMEGFVPAQLDELLQLGEKGLKSVAILTLGYRDAANDWLVNMKKVRISKEDLFTEIA